MDGSQTINPHDIFSYLGRDYVVEGLLTYEVPGKTYRLARVVDGDVVLWVEPLTDDADDRLLVLTEVHDLAIGIPPPQSISYRNHMFVQRFSGMAKVAVAGTVAGRTAGAADVWRYRAAGDLFLQIESTATGHMVLFGESVHKGMVDVLPGR
jgi:ABC-type molybdate transport system ATPase subunit